MWKLVHNISYLETDNAKIDRINVKCRLCQEVDVNREHLLLSCNRLNGIGQALMNTLHIFNPRYTEEEVLMIDLDAGFPQVDWLVANVIYYIAQNRESCVKDKVLTYLMSTREILIRSRYCDKDLKISTLILIETFENFM